VDKQTTKIMEIIGQITVDTDIWSSIYEVVQNPNIKNIVEIGTWNGMGSTLCVIDGIKNFPNDKYFWSIELYPNMYKSAVKNLNDFLTPNIKLLNGRIIEPEEVYWFDHSTINLKSDSHAIKWYNKDMKFLKNSENVLSELPESIDLLILDGGEYTTYPEYHKLKDRTNTIVLDDVNILKCKKIREELLSDSNFKLLNENLEERNGFSIFQRNK
jgi:hypothetical protein